MLDFDFKKGISKKKKPFLQRTAKNSTLENINSYCTEWYFYISENR